MVVYCRGDGTMLLSMWGRYDGTMMLNMWKRKAKGSYRTKDLDDTRIERSRSQQFLERERERAPSGTRLYC